MRNQPPYTMHVLGASEVVAALDFESTIEALRQMFRSGCEQAGKSFLAALMSRKIENRLSSCSCDAATV